MWWSSCCNKKTYSDLNSTFVDLKDVLCGKIRASQIVSFCSQCQGKDTVQFSCHPHCPCDRATLFTDPHHKLFANDILQFCLLAQYSAAGSLLPKEHALYLDTLYYKDFKLWCLSLLTHLLFWRDCAQCHGSSYSNAWPWRANLSDLKCKWYSYMRSISWGGSKKYRHMETVSGWSFNESSGLWVCTPDTITKTILFCSCNTLDAVQPFLKALSS